MDNPNGELNPGWALDDVYRRLPGHFYTTQPAERVGEEPILVHASASAAALIDLGPGAFRHPDFAGVFSGHVPMAGFPPFASVYAGHQFGVFVNQLGDGRALTIAQLTNAKGERWDVQLKGAGRTPYSRFADGRAVLRSSIREYLCSEAIAALGIPTTRAMAVIASREGVQREVVEPGAVVTRLAPSFIRFGHFEFFHHRGQTDDVKRLADHVIETYFPELAAREDRYAAWFGEVVARTADLMAAWQAVGFAHGVMNTDNMSILGLTIDYGPFGFLDAYEPGFICNHSDEAGRYAFERQPGIGLWNLQALASALTSLVPVETLRAVLEGYAGVFREAMVTRFRAKLGLSGAEAGDAMLVNTLLKAMAKGGADYTLTFRGLSRVDEEEAAWLGLFGAGAEDARGWLEAYRARLGEDDPVARRVRMNAVNPKYVLRNWVAETAIRAVEDRGDVGTLDRIFRAVTAPFDEHPEAEEFAAPPPPQLCGLEVSCSS
ncbi:Protein adenylyltransferase SelO [Alphaproteobacteria bacterium SO-S41]|nr:Protein adenylyltransferase SelO [Alphaproteobacteria bacterium SO-S41]